MSTHGSQSERSNSTASQLYVTGKGDSLQGPGRLTISATVDIAIELTNIDGKNFDTPLDLDELCVFGLGGTDDDGKSFALTKVSPTRWTMPSSIEL